MENRENILNNSDVNISVREKSDEDEPGKPLDIKVYKRRWIMLACFCFVAAPIAAQWIQYSIIANIVMKYYNVSSLAVDNTSLIYMFTYIPLVFPAFYVIDKKGLRFSTIVAAFGISLGSWIKVASVSPDRFYVTFIGQTVSSISQVFILSIPSQLAGTWFGPTQVSTACSIGVFGTLIGTAFGFLVTPILVKNHESVENIGDDLYKMFLFQAAFTSVVLIAVIALFEKQPPLPPNNAQALQINQSYSKKELTKTFKRLFKNPAFISLFVTFSISLGVYNAVSTLLNQFTLIHFPNSEEFAGRIGLDLILTGMIGSIVFGFILDKTRKFKEFTVFVYLMSAVGMAAYSFSMGSKNYWFVYICSGILGVFMTGYMPVGFELCAELTYPEPESISSGILVAGSQLSGILFVLLFGWIMKHFGDLYANIPMCGLLVIGTVITAMTPNILRRQDALQINYQYKMANGVEMREK